MKYEEISTLVQFNEKYESSLFMVNEIFDDLKKSIKNSPHIAFSYSYIYLCTWIYRHAKHFNVAVFDNALIKEILGFNPGTRPMNYLIKHNGLLDKIEYLSSTRDYPVDYILNDEKDVEFTMSSELKDMKDYLPEVPKRSFLKCPLKGFYRIIEDEEDGTINVYEVTGTFYDIKNTHSIPFEVFMHCMSNKEVGCIGFYLYAYLSHKCDLHEGEYGVSLENLATDTGIGGRTLDKYLAALKSYKLVDFRHNQEFFAIGMMPEDREANTYSVRGHYDFSNIPVPFDTIEIMKKKDYFEVLALENPPVELIEFDIDELPY